MFFGILGASGHVPVCPTTIPKPCYEPDLTRSLKGWLKSSLAVGTASGKDDDSTGREHPGRSGVARVSGQALPLGRPPKTENELRRLIDHLAEVKHLNVG